MTQKFSLKKHERLKSKMLLDQLFLNGSSAFVHPIKALYQFDELPQGEWPLLFSVSVPKKKIKSAVTRNLVKRRIREAYRLHKLELQDSLIQLRSLRCSLMLIYIENEPKEYDKLEKAVMKILKKLNDAIPS